MAEGPHCVGRLPKVEEQAHDLVSQATELGMRAETLTAMHHMLQRLEESPLDWGDPLYHTKHEGGIVFHAALPPLNVHYVVFQNERKVYVTDLAWLRRPTK